MNAIKAEMKNMLYEVDSRFNFAEKKISDLEDIIMGTIQNETQETEKKYVFRKDVNVSMNKKMPQCSPDSQSHRDERMQKDREDPRRRQWTERSQ